MTNGKIVDGRYEIIEEVGRGGMAIVYLAKCLVLNRYVAIKVLRPEFRDDEDFIKRFKIEAQSAGNLTHPNIVSIYDVGNEGDFEYIVMEYVEGITLKQYLSAKGMLPEKEAVDFAAQICSGLEHAHKKGIVHKDIKPENILITKEGILKITDFGIAKALNQGTITTGGLAMGSVHYFSPEQARGSYIDAKTDIYSVGVLLYEMVTGKRPFDGESAISVAMQHIEKEPVRPSLVNALVTPSLENVILKAMKKDTFERYQSATQMLIDLKKVSVGSGVAAAPVKKPAVPPTAPAAGTAPAADRRPGAATGAKKAPAPAKKKKKSDTVAIVAGIISAVALIVLLGFLYVWIFQSGGKNEIKTPDFYGMTYEEVMEVLEKDEYKKLEVVMDNGAEIPEDIEGVVQEQSPSKGKKIKNNSKVKLIFGDAPAEQVEIPSLEERTETYAEEKLLDLGFKVKIEDISDDEIPEGRVVKTEPSAGTMADHGSTVTIYVSSGEKDKYTRVPDLTGKTEEEARKLLEEADLVFGGTYPVESDKKEGTIVTQSKDAGYRVEKGTDIHVGISTGPKETPDEPDTPNNPDEPIIDPSNPAA